MPVQEDSPGLDHDLTAVEVHSVPAQSHHLGAAQSAQCQPPRRCPLIPSDEYQGLGYAEKRERLAFREQSLRDIEERLKDEGLSDTQRNRYAVTAEKLLHGIAEERGQLPTRPSLELDLKGNPFAGIDAVSIDEDGSLHPVRT